MKVWRRSRGELGREQWHVDGQSKVLLCDGDGGHDVLLLDQEICEAVFHAGIRYTRIVGKSGYIGGIYVRNSADGAIWRQAKIGDGKGGFPFGQTVGSDGQKQSES